MAERTTEVRSFEPQVAIKYSDMLLGSPVLSRRLSMGWILLYAGITTQLDPTWTMESLLYEAGSSPIQFAGFWTVRARDWLWPVDPLNEGGETLIGLRLLLGALLRIAAALGIVAMAFSYFAHLSLESGFILDFHFVYATIMFGLAAVSAGRLLGLDYSLENRRPVTTRRIAIQHPQWPRNVERESVRGGICRLP